jgi:hypothetical protein
MLTLIRPGIKLSEGLTLTSIRKIHQTVYPVNPVHPVNSLLLTQIPLQYKYVGGRPQPCPAHARLCWVSAAEGRQPL